MDATSIAAPNSTKSKNGERDPEMHYVKKGNQCHFRIKAHIGVDADPAWCTPSSARRPTSTMSPKGMVCCKVKNKLSLLIRAYQDALPQAKKKDGATHHTVCALQYLDGQKQLMRGTRSGIRWAPLMPRNSR